MTVRKKPTHGIPESVLDELLKGRDATEIFSSEGLMGELKQALAERMLNAEMDVHLDEEERESGNHRNGYSEKTVITDEGSLRLAIPRDRHGTFDPILIEKYRRRFPGFDEKIISMYSRGMTTREIQGHVLDIYGLDVSATLVSAVTDAVHAEVEAWRGRQLERTYAIVYLDAIRARMRYEGHVENRAVHLAVGIRCSGEKEVLGMWLQQNEGAKFWLGVLTDLKNRGLEDILIAVVDGLKGFPEAIEAAYPQALVQTCIVHLLRNSLHLVPWKDRKELTRALKRVYQAPSAEAAATELEAFEQSELGRRYSAIAPMWHRQWEQVIPFFDFPEPIRRIIYTTNAIESLNSTLRRAVRQRGHFPSEQAAMKLIFLTLQRTETKWTKPLQWGSAMMHFAIRFGERFEVN